TLRRPLHSTLFPYTTLFRSGIESSSLGAMAEKGGASDRFDLSGPPDSSTGCLLHPDRSVSCIGGATLVKSLSHAQWIWTVRGDRSEEHTSELQSQSNIVCRL